ncbi:hypothetical protein A1353_02620 [Methylomonas methanica]|uniref:Uncharacterized protein n=1 Tax=Methylomonas methanica TaxID=421 RepID=A0A177LX56_METMH|nr:hypothetical protein A1353_02620 [Methylomonas methanica]
MEFVAQDYFYAWKLATALAKLIRDLCGVPALTSNCQRWFVAKGMVLHRMLAAANGRNMLLPIVAHWI